MCFAIQTPSSRQSFTGSLLKNEESNSWMHMWHVNSILKDYSLPSTFSLVGYQPPKDKWSEQVKKAVLSHWENKTEN